MTLTEGIAIVLLSGLASMGLTLLLIFVWNMFECIVLYIVDKLMEGKKNDKSIHQRQA